MIKQANSCLNARLSSTVFGNSHAPFSTAKALVLVNDAEPDQNDFDRDVKNNALTITCHAVGTRLSLTIRLMIR